MKLFIVFLAFAFAFASGDENDGTTVSQVDESPADQENSLDPDSPFDSEKPEDNENPDKIIANGFAAHETTAPYIVGLSLHKNSNDVATLCGGSIIGSTWVLTSAFCLDGHDYADVYSGSIWKWHSQLNYRVQRNNFYKHHLYVQSNGNDIGLIRTPQIYFNSRVNFVKLPSFNQMSDQFLYQSTISCGWGALENGQEADSLRCATNQVISNDDCSYYYGNLPIDILCVDTQHGRSTCKGDFGGPLVTLNNPIQIGVTSFVSGAGCTVGHPAGFTRVSAHLNWIRQITGIAYFR